MWKEVVVGDRESRRRPGPPRSEADSIHCREGDPKVKWLRQLSRERAASEPGPSKDARSWKLLQAKFYDLGEAVWRAAGGTMDHPDIRITVDREITDPRRRARWGLLRAPGTLMPAGPKPQLPEALK